MRDEAQIVSAFRGLRPQGQRRVALGPQRMTQSRRRPAVSCAIVCKAILREAA
jgi:hypothetical protein